MISGEYISVFSNPAVADKEFPITWEKGVFKQKGAKLHYHCIENDYSFEYEMVGTIYDNMIVGYWYSKKDNELVHGSVYLHITARGNLVGVWAGDAKPNDQKTFGYWALSKDRDVLNRFVKDIHLKGRFKTLNLLSYIKE